MVCFRHVSVNTVHKGDDDDDDDDDGKRESPKFKKHVLILSSTARLKPSAMSASWLRLFVIY
jgi:hypothetical protein